MAPKKDRWSRAKFNHVLKLSVFIGFLLGPILANFDSGGNPWKYCSVYIHDEQKQKI